MGLIPLVYQMSIFEGDLFLFREEKGKQALKLSLYLDECVTSFVCAFCQKDGGGCERGSFNT